jgi:isopenicillin-N epimerase
MHTAYLREFTLDPTIRFLNHGSFGACPRAVQEAQRGFRDALEREPVQFLVRHLEPLLDETRTALAAFVGADPAGLVFVPNATTGVATALAALDDLAPGDALLVTDHGYNACRNAIERIAARTGAVVQVARLPFAGADEEALVAAILDAVTPRTRYALLDHVTSPTALVLPIARLVASLRERGVETIVDGAHAPGMLPLDVSAIDAAWYTGNCHKWIAAPKGAAFLVTRADRRDRTPPLVTSHGANSPRTDRSRYLLEHDWCGTHDPSAVLAIPMALRTMAALLPGGFPALMTHNRALALEGRAILADALGLDAPLPDAARLGTMAALPLPKSPWDDAPRDPNALFDPLQTALFDRHRIEVPIIPWPALGLRFVRVSGQLYNDASDYHALVAALRAEGAIPG